MDPGLGPATCPSGGGLGIPTGHGGGGPGASIKDNATETALLTWCHSLAARLADVSADIASLRKGLEATQHQFSNDVSALSRGLDATQQQLRTLSGKRDAEDRERQVLSGNGHCRNSVQLDDLTRHSHELRAALADGLRGAELQASMTVNRALAEGASEAAMRELAVRRQLGEECSELRSHLQYQLGEELHRVEARCATRLQEALRPDLVKERELRERVISGLGTQVQGMGARIADLESRGENLVKWIQSELCVGKVTVSGLLSDVEAARRERASLRETIRECEECVARQRDDKSATASASSNNIPLSLNLTAAINVDGCSKGCDGGKPKEDNKGCGMQKSTATVGWKCDEIRSNSHEHVTPAELAEGLRSAEMQAASALAQHRDEDARALSSHRERHQVLGSLVDELSVEQQHCKRLAEERQRELDTQRESDAQSLRLLEELHKGSTQRIDTLEVSVRELRDEGYPTCCHVLQTEEDFGESGGKGVTKSPGTRVLGILVEPSGCAPVSGFGGSGGNGVSFTNASARKDAWAEPQVNETGTASERKEGGSGKARPPSARRWFGGLPGLAGTLPRKRK